MSVSNCEIYKDSFWGKILSLPTEIFLHIITCSGSSDWAAF